MYENFSSDLTPNLISPYTSSVETWIKRFKTKFSDKRLIIYLHPEETNFILKEKKKFVKNLLFKNWMLVDFKSNSELALNNFTVYSKKQRKDVTNEV